MKIYSLLIALFFFACNTSQQSKQQKTIELEFTINKVSSPVKSSIRGISCVDSSTVWLSGAKGTVIRSLDGGKNWDKLIEPDNDSLDFRDVQAFSKDEAIIVSAGFPSRVYRTINGGKSWSLVHENNDSAAFMNSIEFKNRKEGVILGDQLFGRHLILTTSDGGATWSRVDSTYVPQPLAIENGFAASGSCITINKEGHFFIGLGGERTRVFSSVDGLNWRATNTPMVHGEGGASGIYSIAYGNDLIMAVGGNYSKPDSTHYPIISRDQGNSWQPTPAKVNGYRSVIAYCSKADLWVCGGTNGIDWSNNNGKNWENISSENVNTLQFLPNTSKAIAASSKGNICLLDFQLTN